MRNVVRSLQSPAGAAPSPTVLVLALVLLLLVASGLVLSRSQTGISQSTSQQEQVGSSLPSGLPGLPPSDAAGASPSEEASAGVALWPSVEAFRADWNAELDRLLAAVGPGPFAAVRNATDQVQDDDALLRLDEADFAAADDGALQISVGGSHGARLEVMLDGDAVAAVTAVGGRDDVAPGLGSGVPVVHLLLHAALAANTDRDVVRIAGDLGVGTGLGAEAVTVIGFGRRFDYDVDDDGQVGGEGRLTVTAADGSAPPTLPTVGPLRDPDVDAPLGYPAFVTRWNAEVERVAPQLAAEARDQFRQAFRLPDGPNGWTLVELPMIDGALLLQVADSIVWEATAVTAVEGGVLADGVLINALLTTALTPRGAPSPTENVAGLIAAQIDAADLMIGPNTLSVDAAGFVQDRVRVTGPSAF